MPNYNLYETSKTPSASPISLLKAIVVKSLKKHAKQDQEGIGTQLTQA